MGTPGLSLDDRLIFTDDLFDDAGYKIGLDDIDCVIVRLDPAHPEPEQQFLQCTISVSLAAGQLTFQELVHGADNFFALTGGTGSYRTARRSVGQGADAASAGGCDDHALPLVESCVK